MRKPIFWTMLAHTAIWSCLAVIGADFRVCALAWMLLMGIGSAIAYDLERNYSDKRKSA